MGTLLGQSVEHGTFNQLRHAGYDVRTVGQSPGDFYLAFDDSALPLPKAWQPPHHVVRSLPAEILIADCHVFPSGTVLVDNFLVFRDVAFIHMKRNRLLHVSPETKYHQESGSVLVSTDYPVTTFDGPVFVATNFRTGNFYHFVHEVLARAYFLDHAERILGQELPVLMAMPKFPMQEFLLSAVFGNRKVIHHKTTTHRIKQAVISRSPVSPHGICVPAIRHLREKLRNIAEPTMRGAPLYISRKDGRNRSFSRDLPNEPDLAERLSRFGFTEVVVSKISPDLQLQMFTSAPAMAGIHGAGLSNALFMADESSLLEVSGIPQTGDLFARDARVCGLDYSLAESRPDGVCLDAVEQFLQHLSDRLTAPRPARHHPAGETAIALDRPGEDGACRFALEHGAFRSGGGRAEARLLERKHRRAYLRRAARRRVVRSPTA
jgi:capsular polysaccharide biosynthesis protein